MGVPDEGTQRDARPFCGYRLQQSRGTKTRDRIGQCNRFTLENPTSHRNPQSRVAQMNQLHSPPRSEFHVLGDFLWSTYQEGKIRTRL